MEDTRLIWNDFGLIDVIDLGSIEMSNDRGSGDNDEVVTGQKRDDTPETKDGLKFGLGMGNGVFGLV